jgi:hypothetical protein
VTKPQGPKGRVPLSQAVKRSLYFIGGMFAIAGAVEIYMLANPETVAPISWGFWYLNENVPWLPIMVSGVAGAFFSHFFWYRRPGAFWYPLTLRAALIICGGSIGACLAAQAWAFALGASALFGAGIAAHRWWFRVELFDEHLAQFHDDEGEK